MLNPELCREVLEAILGLEIRGIEYAGHQEQLDVTPTAKSVRLDVIVQDEKGTVYNVEMQKVNTHELPHRSRYYHAMLALDQIQKGESYKSLKNTFVIFICNFDLFAQGRRVYYFENACRDVDGLKLGDGASTIFLAANAPGHPNDDRRLVEFLDYVSKGAVTGDLSAKLHAEVASVLDSEKWRAEYMYLQVRDQLNYERGEQEGRESGIKEGYSLGHVSGFAEGEDALAQLVSALIQHGRSGEIERIATDVVYRQDLYREFGIA